MKTIIFSDITWYIKEGKGLGPGSNNWSRENVFVDSKGFLHLRIDKKDGKWFCAEIYTKDRAQCGEYIFYLDSNVEMLDKNMVLGLFLYEDDNKEVDIEFYNGEGYYCIQQKETYRFTLNLTGSYSEHRIWFYPYSIEFESYHGHSWGPLIAKWRSKTGSSIKLSNSKLHINFWLKHGKAPLEGAEIIIKNIKINYAEHAAELT